jgi:PAS domain-containing protein
LGERKDGSEFPIEIMLSPLQSAEGTLVTAAIRDISVRKAAETHLAQMEGRYRGLLEAAPDAMVVVNQKRRDRPAERSGGEAVRLPPRRTAWPEGHEHHPDRLCGAADRGRSALRGRRVGAADRHRDRARCRAKDGSEFPIEIMLSPLESAEGTLVTAAIRDISVRKKAAVVFCRRWRN